MSNSEETEKAKVIEIYSAIFLNSDLHQWHNVKVCFADSVNLDYSSLSGQPSSLLKSEEIVRTWSSFLPTFNFTMHYLTNHVVSVQADKAIASCYGHAIHQLIGAEGGDIWEVFGTYDFQLEKIKDTWKVTSLKYNHKYASGNLKLPVLASTK